MYTTQALPVNTDRAEVFKPRQPFVLPAPNKGEEYEDYVTAVKPDAPFEYCTLGPLNFEKRVLPEEASLAENAEKHYDYGVLVRKLTKTQAESLRKRAQEITKRIPTRVNRDWKPDCGQPEYFPAYDVCLADWLILEPMAGFNPLVSRYENPAKVAQEAKDAGEKYKDELYEAQRKGKK